MYSNTGEVKLGSLLGQRLLSLALDPRYGTYVETGTRNGDGSTYCLLSGLLSRPDSSKLYSLETNDAFYRTACSNLKHVDQAKLELIFGSLVTYDELPVMPTWNNCTKESYMYNIDLKTAQCATSRVPEFIDVLFLDSGGWSREAEWLKYKNKTNVIVIDDTKVSTNKIRDEIKMDSEHWAIVDDVTNDRNGWLCAVRKKSYEK